MLLKNLKKSLRILISSHYFLISSLIHYIYEALIREVEKNADNTMDVTDEDVIRLRYATEYYF